MDFIFISPELLIIKFIVEFGIVTEYLEIKTLIMIKVLISKYSVTIPNSTINFIINSSGDIKMKSITQINNVFMTQLLTIILSNIELSLLKINDAHARRSHSVIN